MTLIRRASQLGYIEAQYFLAASSADGVEQLFWYGLAAGRHYHAREAFLKMISTISYAYFYLGEAIGPRVYQAGLSVRQHMHGGHLFEGANEPYEHDHRICSDAQQCMATQTTWAAYARLAVDMWVLIARRGRGTIKGVNRDIRNKIAKLVWAHRVDWPNDPPESAETKLLQQEADAYEYERAQKMARTEN